MNRRRRMALLIRRLRRANRSEDEDLPDDFPEFRGVPIEPRTRHFLEDRFSHRLDDVAVHDDPDSERAAASLGARAFTAGRDIFLGASAPGLDTPGGLHVLAHEAAHAVQNAGTESHDAFESFEVGDRDDPAEFEAEDAARRALAGGNFEAGALQPSHAGSAAAEGGVIRCWPDWDLDWLTDLAPDDGVSALDLLSPIGSLAGSVLPEFELFPAAQDVDSSGRPADAPEVAPAPSDQTAPTVDQSMVDNTVSNLQTAMVGLGTDEQAIYRALRGKSPAEIAAIKAHFKSATGVSLDAALEDEMSGTELEEAKAYLTGDPAKGAAAALVNASEGLGTDEASIREVLAGLPPEQRERLKSEYASKAGRSLEDMLEDELSGSDLDRAKRALRKGAPPPAQDSSFWQGA